MYKCSCQGDHRDRKDKDAYEVGKIGKPLALQPRLNGLSGILSIDASDTPLFRLSTSREERSLFKDFDRSMPDPCTRVCSKRDSWTFSWLRELSSSKSQPMEGKASPSDDDDDDTALNMESNSKDSALEARIFSSSRHERRLFFGAC